MIERPSPSENSQSSGAAQSVTLRAVLLGLLLVVFLCIVTPYTDLVMQSSLIACDHLPIGVLTIFVLLVVIINPILRRLPLKRPFASGELITVYAMMLVAAGIPSFGLVDYLFPVVTAPFYYASPENKWAQLLHQFIPRWFSPRDGHAVTRYYEGLKQGESIPWGPWIKPLLGWSIFIFALYLVIACLATILRKQWVERERLSFPLVQLPMEIVRDQDAEGRSPIFRNRLLWIGFAIPVSLHTMNSLSTYIPSIPALDIKWVEITSVLTGHPPWEAIRPIYVFIYFSVIGFAYLLSSDVALGLVVFYFFYKLQAIAAAAIGYNDPWMYGYLGPGYLAHQGAGAIFAIVVSSVWMARKQISEVVAAGLGRGRKGADADEPMSYRTAFYGLIIGTLVLLAWCWAAGMNPLVAGVVIIFFYVVMIGLAKFVADSGLLFVQAPFQPGDLVTTAVGTAPLGSANLILFGILQFIFMFDLRSFLMPSLMDGFKLSDGPQLRRRSLFKAMALAVVVGVVVSYVSAITWTYRIGGSNMHGWFYHDANRVPYMRAIDQISNAVPPNLKNLAFTGVGALVCGVVIFMRQRYIWWPVHPIGYAMGSTLAMTQMWLPLLIGYMLKGFVLRYGGRKLYVQFRPFFLGLVLGEFTLAGLWVILDVLLGVRGHSIFPN